MKHFLKNFQSHPSDRLYWSKSHSKSSTVNLNYRINHLIVLLFIQQFACAQIASILPEGKSIAETSVADIRNWTAFNNPAMIGYFQQTEIGISMSNRSLLTELSTKSIQAGFHSSLVNIGVSFSHFGYSLYHEMLIGCGLSRNFMDKFSMGVQFNYYMAYFDASNTYRGTLLPQVGLSVKLSPLFNLGFNTFNPFQTNIKTEFVTKRIPSIFSFGTSCLLSPELVWLTQIDKEVSSNYRFATGFDYQMIENVSVKLGAYATDYLVPCLGVGFRVGFFRFDLNAELHPLLGLNTFASVDYLLR